VVDDAIMVMENIYRHGEGGEDRVTAAREGTKEITFAALSATLAVIAIFLPVVFMEGIVGKYFLQFGVALVVAVSLSYLEAMTLAPARCAQMLSFEKSRQTRLGRAWTARSCAWRAATAGAALGAAPLGLVLAGAAAIFVGAIFVFRAMPKEMVPARIRACSRCA